MEKKKEGLNICAENCLQFRENRYITEKEAIEILNSKAEEAAMDCSEIENIFHIVKEYIKETDRKYSRGSQCINLYKLSKGSYFGYRKGLHIALFELSKEEKEFIIETASILRCRLGIPVFISNNLIQSTHIIVRCNIHGKCKRSYAYVLGILFGKSIVGFNWYLELLCCRESISIETSTLLNIVQTETEPTDASEMACIYGIGKGIFSNINITGCIASKEKELIILLNGTAEKSNARPSLKINTYEELYCLIVSDSTTPWYLTIFPERNYMYY